MCVLATERKDGTPIEWEQAKGFSKYLISDDGQVYSLINDKILAQEHTHRGYQRVVVCDDNGIPKHMRVHRLVYMAHKGEIPKGIQVNHKDECKTNNCIENLNLMTNKENSAYSVAQRKKGMRKHRKAVAC